MPEKASLPDRLDRLNDAQMKQLLGRLMLEVNPAVDPILDPDELEQQSAADRALLTEAAGTLGIVPETAPDPSSAARQLVLAIGQVSPEYEKIVDEGLAEVEGAGAKLDFGVTAFVIAPIALAIAAAIARPSLNFESSAAKSGDKKTKLSLKFTGVKNIEAVIAAVAPFLKPYL